MDQIMSDQLHDRLATATGQAVAAEGGPILGTVTLTIAELAELLETVERLQIKVNRLERQLPATTSPPI